MKGHTVIEKSLLTWAASHADEGIDLHISSYSSLLRDFVQFICGLFDTCLMPSYFGRRSRVAWTRLRQPSGQGRECCHEQQHHGCAEAGINRISWSSGKPLISQD